MFAWKHRPQKHIKIKGKVVSAPFYYRWRAMRSRCYHSAHPEAKRYTDRGIKVCDEWQDFWKFYDWCVETFEPNKTIDRINNDENYSPSNCRWATPLEQQLNSRITPARLAAMRVAKKAQVASLHKKWGDPITRKQKHCSCCKQIKLNRHFSKHKGAADGLQKLCKQCQAENHERNRK